MSVTRVQCGVREGRVRKIPVFFFFFFRERGKRKSVQFIKSCRKNVIVIVLIGEFELLTWRVF